MQSDTLQPDILHGLSAAVSGYNTGWHTKQPDVPDV